MTQPDRFDAAARQALWQRMRLPVAAFAALLTLLAIIVLTGFMQPPGAGWIVIGLTLCMALTVLLFSMEVPHDAPVTRLFAGLGFAWVCILFGMTLLDYLSR